MIRKPHLRLIASHSVRHGIRGGAGLVAVFLTLVVGLVLSGIVLDPLSTIDDQVDRTAARMHEQISDADRARIHDEITASVIKVGGKAINWAIEPSDNTLDYLTVERPVIISAILVLLMLVTPFLACLAGFNQTAGDISTKGLRFILIRTERPNIFIGRFLGTYVFMALVFLLLFIIVGVYTGLKVHVHPTGEMIAWLFQGYLRLMLLGLPYIALCAFVSCAIDSAFGSLCIALLIAYFVPLLVSVGSGINAGVKYLGYITPWGFKYWLLEPFGLKFLGGIAAMLGFTVLLLWAGLRHFSKRDL
jgi:ABC-type transport system involved in multi-copper enzyme maturation permease subunit